MSSVTSAPREPLKRRSHKKSRTGCVECRRRRIKCTEDKPECRACVRRAIPCVYLSTAQNGKSCSSPDSDRSNARAATVSPRVTESVGSPLTSTTFSIDDLSLLHHWTLSTSRSIAESATLHPHWQTVLPQIAFRYPFMMHGILGLAALHLAYLQPDNMKQLLIDAAQHHNIALQGFREQVTQLNDDNSDALFACASLNVLYVFGMFGQRYARQNGEADTAFCRSRILGAEWIPMIRGVEAVLQSVYNRVRFGPLNLMLELGNWDEIDPDDGQTAMDVHLRLIRPIWTGSGDERVYDKTLHVLRKCCAYVQQFIVTEFDALPPRGHRRIWSGILMVLHFAPEEYFVLLQQRQPVALVLYAYFGILLHSAEKYWFLEGWGRSIVETVDELLGDYWNTWMKWPKEVVGLG